MDEEIQKLIDDGKLVSGNSILEHSYFLDEFGYIPSKGTKIASDVGPCVFEKALDDFFSVKTVYGHDLAHRVSILLFDEQKKLLKQLEDECITEKTERGYRGTMWNLETRAFVTLENIMRAQGKGIYSERKGFEPFADPNNKDLIYECLPYLFAERKHELLGKRNSDDKYLKRAQDKLEKLSKGLNVSPEELMDNIMQIGNCCHGPNYFIGGCLTCEIECH